MSVKSPLGLVLYCYLNMPTINKTYLILSYTPAPPEEVGILFDLYPSVPGIFSRIFLSNYWHQKSDIWSQASYRYAILWEAFLDLLHVCQPIWFLYTHWIKNVYMQGYHKWALAHSSSCFYCGNRIHNIVNLHKITIFP